MTKIITVMNLKGGTAKTTTACFLAHAYAAQGKDVIMVDADPQGSLQEWSGQADFSIPVISKPATKLHRTLPGIIGDRFDVVVIDTPPLDEEAGIVYGALRAADAVVIPTSPSTMERDAMPAVWATLRKIQDDRDDNLASAVLMTRINRSANSGAIIADGFKKNGHTVLDTMITRLEALALAKGFPVTELYGYDKVAAELDELMKGTI